MFNYFVAVANKIYQYQIQLCLQVHLLKCKSRQLVKLCLMKLVHDHILLQSDMKSFNASILMSLFFPNISSTSPINLDSTTNDQSSTRMFGKVCLTVYPIIFKY